MTLSMGTSAAIRMSYPEPILPQTPSTWCYYGAEGKRIVGAATSGAGNCVEWFAKKMLLGNYKYRELDDMVAQRYSQPFDAPIFLPFNFGERCPRLGRFALGRVLQCKRQAWTA